MFMRLNKLLYESKIIVKLLYIKGKMLSNLISGSIIDDLRSAASETTAKPVERA